MRRRAATPRRQLLHAWLPCTAILRSLQCVQVCSNHVKQGYSKCERGTRPRPPFPLQANPAITQAMARVAWKFRLMCPYVGRILSDREISWAHA